VLAIVVAGSAAALAGSQATPVASTGLTAQRLPITLTVAPDGRTLSLDIRWVASCGGVVRTIRSAVTTIAAGGEFAWEGTHINALDDGDEDRQRLRLSGRRESDGALTGAWQAERDAFNGQGRTVDETCRTGDVAFRVTRGGSTRQPPPQRGAGGQLVIGLEDQPELVATGDGRTWVLGTSPQVSGDRPRPATVTAIDQRTGDAAAPVQLKGSSFGRFAAGEGAAWALTTYPQVRLLRIDARTQRLVRGPRLRTGGGADGLAAGAGGVWVLAGDRILRADPRNGRLVRSIRVPHDRRVRSARRCQITTHTPLIAVDRRDVWVMSRTYLSCRSSSSPRNFALARNGPYYSLLRIDARANRVGRSLVLTREYAALAVRRGRVWGIGCLRVPTREGEFCRRAAVHRIDLRNGRPAVVVALRSSASEPTGVSGLASGLGVGPGAIWVVELDTSLPGSARRSQRPKAFLRRIDAETRRLTTARTLPRSPADLAVDDRGAWVLDNVERTLIRVQP